MGQRQIDPQAFPEPIRSLLKGMDLKMLEVLLSNVDRSEVNKMIEGLKQMMGPDEVQALENFIKTMSSLKG